MLVISIIHEICQVVRVGVCMIEKEMLMKENNYKTLCIISLSSVVFYCSDVPLSFNVSYAMSLLCSSRCN